MRQLMEWQDQILVPYWSDLGDVSQALLLLISAVYGTKDIIETKKLKT